MALRDKFAFGAAISILLAVGAISYRALGVARQSEEWVEHTHQVLENFQDLLLDVETLESSARGFAVTGQESHLDPYRAGLLSLQRHLSEVQRLTADNPVQQQQLPALESLVAQRVANLGKVIALRRQHGRDAAEDAIREGEGSRLMNRFQGIAGAMQAEELTLLAQRNQGLRSRLSQTRLALLFGALLGISISASAAWSVQRESLRRGLAERALQQSEKRFRGLLEAAPDAMVVFDPGGKIVLLNAQTESQFGYRREELLGRGIQRILPRGFSENPIQSPRSFPETSSESPCIAQGDTQSSFKPASALAGRVIEVDARRKDGSEFPVEITLSPLESSEELLTTASIRNITERRKFAENLARTAAELRRSNFELQQFAYIASHDLQEPLRMVASYTQLLAERYRGRLDEDADEFIRYSVEGCKRMKKLIQDLIAYSSAGSGGRSLRRTPAESALKTALTNLRSSIMESQAIVSHEPLPNIVTDEALLVQIFQNLIGNAIKYRGTQTPKVHVSAWRGEQREWVFSVRDNGIGIDPRYFEKIFVLFQRLHSRNQFNGTGIGLTLCKKIVEGLGGRIWVDSQPGHGATFFFSLPENAELPRSSPDQNPVAGIEPALTTPELFLSDR